MTYTCCLFRILCILLKIPPESSGTKNDEFPLTFSIPVQPLFGQVPLYPEINECYLTNANFL